LPTTAISWPVARNAADLRSQVPGHLSARKRADHRHQAALLADRAWLALAEAEPDNVATATARPEHWRRFEPNEVNTPRWPVLESRAGAVQAVGDVGQIAVEAVTVVFGDDLLRGFGGQPAGQAEAEPQRLPVARVGVGIEDGCTPA
jgi:hypothetical protein